MDYGFLIFSMVVIFIASLFAFSKSKTIREYKNEIFIDKDLPLLKEKKIGFGIKFDLKFYDLKKTKKGDIDRENLWYLKIAQIVNSHMTFTVNDEMELDVVLDDLTLPEFKDDYNDIVEILTNFKYRQFAFKKESGIDSLLDIESKIMDELKQHADNIIHEVFVDVTNNIEELVEAQFETE